MTRFDFHIHTALSACAENIMSPGQILSRAKSAGLDMIAITDHNASANVSVSIRFGNRLGIKVIPGIEVTALEEVHILGLFENLHELEDFQKLVDSTLPSGKNIPEISGHQLVFDYDDEITDIDENIRNIGLSLSSDRIISEIKKRNGYVIPAHIHKRVYSLISQLGFIDPNAGFDAVEIAAPIWIRDGFKIGQKIEGYPVISGSDSHFLEAVGRFHMEIPETADNLKDLMSIIRAK
jgi:predicted metal-dependent phosphoesterase TrpH